MVWSVYISKATAKPPLPIQLLSWVSNNAAVWSVQDANSIVMTIDMHLTFPLGSVQYIRKVGMV